MSLNFFPVEKPSGFFLLSLPVDHQHRNATSLMVLLGRVAAILIYLMILGSRANLTSPSLSTLSSRSLHSEGEPVTNLYLDAVVLPPDDELLDAVVLPNAPVLLLLVVVLLFGERYMAAVLLAALMLLGATNPIPAAPPPPPMLTESLLDWKESMWWWLLYTEAAVAVIPWWWNPMLESAAIAEIPRSIDP